MVEKDLYGYVVISSLDRDPVVKGNGTKEEEYEVKTKVDNKGLDSKEKGRIRKEVVSTGKVTV